MQQTNTELAESLHQFVTIWNMIGKPFLRVDQTDRPGLGGTACPTDSPRSDGHQEDRVARHRGRISALFAAWIPSDREVHGMHAGPLTFSCGILCCADIGQLVRQY
jgi:hypothetical protein